MPTSDLARPRNTIDRLPELQRKAVIDAMLRGEPLRSIAKMAGISFASARDYRDRHLIPKLRLTPQTDYLNDPVESIASSVETKSADSPESSTQQNQQLSCVATQTTQNHTRAVLEASPVKRRAESLWRFTASALRDARKASKGEKGDFSPIAPLLNQAHKNLEIQGKLSGELNTDTGRGPSVAIQIVMPDVRTNIEGSRQNVTIDVLGAQIGLKAGR